MINHKRLVVVLGMHRSGTSLLCQVLQQLGLRFPPNLLPAHEQDNPLGYFEAREVVQLNNSFLNDVGINWRTTEPLAKTIFESDIAEHYRKKIRNYLESIKSDGTFVLKDPRLCRLLPLWKPVLSDIFDEIKYIYIIRHPLGVMQSFLKRSKVIALAQAAIESPYHSLSLWLLYNLDLFSNSEETEHLLIDYESLVASPKKYGDQLANFLDLDKKPVINQLNIGVDQVQLSIQLSKEQSKLKHITLDFYIKLYDLFALEKLQVNDINFLINHLQEVLYSRKENISCSNNPLYLTELFRGDIKEFISKTHGRVNRFIWSYSEQRRLELDVLFISHDATTRGHIYRVKHISDALSFNGLRTAWIEISDLDGLGWLTNKVKCVVIFRCENSTHLEKFLLNCRKRGVRIIYDIDDFVFDTSVIEDDEINFISTLEKYEHKQWWKRFQSYKTIMGLADIISVPTYTLQSFSKNLNKQSFVFPNNFDSVNKKIATLALNTKTNRFPGKTVIGYASGTSTHEADFLTIKPALIRLLSIFPNLHIKIIGNLNVIKDSEFDRFKERIHIVAIVAHTSLPFELVDFDINLIPLERNRFTDSKSELKFFEPALLKIPSVAVKNPVYENIVVHGKNGYLAINDSEWITSLTLLIKSSILRKQVGKAAYMTAVELYDVEKLAKQYKNEILNLE